MNELGTLTEQLNRPSDRSAPNVVRQTVDFILYKFRSDVMDRPVELSLEQQFNLRSFETQVEKMSLEQAQHFLVKLYEQMMMRETMYKHFLKHEWGIEPRPQFE